MSDSKKDELRVVNDEIERIKKEITWTTENLDGIERDVLLDHYQRELKREKEKKDKLESSG